MNVIRPLNAAHEWVESSLYGLQAQDGTLASLSRTDLKATLKEVVKAKEYILKAERELQMGIITFVKCGHVHLDWHTNTVSASCPLRKNHRGMHSYG